MTRLALVALGLWGAVDAHAQEYRQFTLSDGRVLVAEVMATEGAGMRVRVPQGETFVPFGQLADMVAVDLAAYEAQDPWFLYLASDAAYRGGFAASFRAIPGLRVIGPGQPGPLPAEAADAMTVCDTDLACLADAAPSEGPWMWLVVAKFDAGDAVFEALVSTGGPPTVTRAPRIDLDAVNAAAWKALGVAPIEPAPPEVVAIKPKPQPTPPRGKPPMTRERVVALSFVPVPGYPSLVQGDTAGFGVAVAAVVPVTAVWVGATGKQAQSAPGHVALGVAGYYAATVVANQALGLRTFNRGETTLAVGVAPTEHGGTALNLTVVR